MIDYSSLLSGLGGVLGGGVLLRTWLASREGKIAELAREVVELRDRTVTSLATRVDTHIAADRSQEFAAKLETVIAQNNEILLEQKKLNRESASHATTVARTEKSLSNLWDKFDNCRSAHGGK